MRNTARFGASALVLLLTACATPVTLEKWNATGRQRVEIVVESLRMPHVVLSWRTTVGANDVEEGWIRLAPPLAGCREVTLYPLRPDGRLVALERGDRYVAVHDGRIPDEAERRFWGQRVPRADCAVLLSLGLPEQGWHSVVSASTSSGRFDRFELQRIVRPEWALVVPAAVAADALLGVSGTAAAMTVGVAVGMASTDTPLTVSWTP